MRIEASRLTPIDDAYETCERTLATLRIGGEELDPTFVTSHLGIQPTKSQKKGEIKTNSRGFERTIKKGGWFLSSEDHVNSKDIRRHLDWLLTRLAPVKDQLRALQEIEGITMDVNCIWWSAGDGGPTLWPEQMRLLAELNLECGFYISFYGDEERSSDPAVESKKKR
jgi:hypothetical protein